MRKIVAFIVVRRRWIRMLCGVLLILMLLVNGFWGLGSGYIRNWDESLYGISACEMLDTGNYLVNTFNYLPDYWNLKPVLAFYGNLAGFLLFGRTLFGLRFFSAVAYLLIAGILFVFLRKEAGRTAALAGCAAFAVAPPNWVHCFSTGDPDAWFILFIFSSFVFLWRSLKRGWLLPAAAFLMALAFLTKSFHAGPYALFSLIWAAVYWKKYRWNHLLCSIPAAVLPVGIWAAARFQADGMKYFRTMIELDLLGRVQNGTPDHMAVSVWYTYLDRLNHHLLFIPIGIICIMVLIGWFFREKNVWLEQRLRPLFYWSAGYFLGIVALYSCCRVKLEWYIWPALPFLAILTGLSFQTACRRLLLAFRHDPVKTRTAYAVFPGLMILLFLIWFGIGEGKAVRVIIRKPRQHDILLSQTPAGREYVGKNFYTVDPEGKFWMPEHSFILVLRLLSGKIVIGNMNEFKHSKKPALLICSFDKNMEGATLQAAAEAFAGKHSLTLIRCVNPLALYQKKSASGKRPRAERKRRKNKPSSRVSGKVPSGI